MGFIERIMEAMKPAPSVEQEIDTENQSDNKEIEVSEEQLQEESDAMKKDAFSEQKSYSQEELDALIKEQKKIWENERMNTLSKDSQIEELKAELMRRDLKEKINLRLEEEKLPLAVGEFVQYTDEVGTMESLEKVVTLMKQLVQEGIQMRLRGKTPIGLGYAANVDEFGRSVFSNEFRKAMKD